MRTWYNQTVSASVKDETDTVYIPYDNTVVDQDIVPANTTQE